MAISFAISLVLILIWSQESATCSGVYRFMSEMRKEDVVSKMDRVIYDACRTVKQESIPSIQWNELGNRIFWPIHTSYDQILDDMSASFIVVDKNLPVIEALINTSRKQELSIGTKSCNAYNISMTGKHRRVETESIQNPIKGALLAGAGNVLICDDSSMPFALSMRLKRTLKPALWSKSNKDVEEEIDVAWSLIP